MWTVLLLLIVAVAVPELPLVESMRAQGMIRAAQRSFSRCCTMAMSTPAGDAAPGSKNIILALDFDGVVCASSSESSFSSIVAAQRFWPTVCGNIMQVPSSPGGSSYASLTTERSDTPFSKIRAAVNELRPIIETGYENMLIVRALYEDYQRTGVISASTILGKWSATYREQLLQDYGTNKDEMVAYFGKTRDDLIAEDLSRWVGLNPVYPSVSACMSKLTEQSVDYTIITTKQERFVRAILETNKIQPPPQEDIYDLENPYGLKPKVLQALIDKYQPKEIHFVEDRFETLVGVLNTRGLERVKMYLVDWGYNTEQQREEAKRLSPRIQLIGGSDFQSLISQFIIPTLVSDSSQV